MSTTAVRHDRERRQATDPDRSDGAAPIGWDPKLLAPIPAPLDPADRPVQPPLFPLLGPPEPAGAVLPARWSGDRVPVRADRLRDLTRVVLEVLTAHRPVAQLDGWVTPRVIAALTRTHHLMATASPERRPRTVRVVSLHPDRLAAEALEVAVHLSADGRGIAMAYQLRRRDRRWWCTAWDHRAADLLGAPDVTGPRPPRG